MTCHGIIKNGQVFVVGGVPLPDGAEVHFELRQLDGNPIRAALNGESDKLPSGVFPDSLIGCITDWPADMAERHDYYLHGRRDR